MIKQIKLIPRYRATSVRTGIFNNFDWSLRQISRHFDLCLNNLNESVRKTKAAELAQAPSPRSINR